MSQTRKRVSIVIPAYNEERYLSACLQAIAAQTVMPAEVLVIDNNSTDRTAAIAAHFAFVTVIREPKQGIVHARNAGFNAACSEIIGRIDADTLLPPDWVAHVTSFYAKGHDNQAWTGRANFYNVRLARAASWVYGFFIFRLNWFLGGHYTLWGSNMALLNDQWQAVVHQTHIRTDIHEDLDLAIHLHQLGYGITYDTAMQTRAALRRVITNRDQLWSYLLRGPRTLRIHGYWTWPLCWLFGTFVLYGIAYILVFIDWLALRFGSQPFEAPA